MSIGWILVADEDEDGDRITVRSHDEMKAMLSYVSHKTLRTCCIFFIICCFLIIFIAEQLLLWFTIYVSTEIFTFWQSSNIFLSQYFIFWIVCYCFATQISLIIFLPCTDFLPLWTSKSYVKQSIFYIILCCSMFVHYLTAIALPYSHWSSTRKVIKYESLLKMDADDFELIWVEYQY